MKYSEKVATSNANQTDNAVEIAVSEKENARVPYKTVNAIIDGEHKKIILAYSKYSMEQPKDKGKLLGSLDKEKLLGVTYN